MSTFRADALSPAIVAAREGRLVILAGAGLSALAPSNVPRWTELYRALLDAMCAAGTKSLNLPPDALTSEVLLSQSSLDSIGAALIGNCSPESVFPVFSAIRGAPLNDAHRAIGRIANAKGLKGLLTTNFDLLLERALTQAGANYHAWTPQVLESVQGIGETPIVKLHGSLIQPESLLETADQKFRPVASHIEAVCTKALKDAFVLIVGYRGADRNVIALLREHASPENMLWITAPGHGLAEEAAPLLQAGAQQIELEAISALAAIADAIDAAPAPPESDIAPLDPARELAAASERWANSEPMTRWVIAGIIVRILPGRHPLIEAIESQVRTEIEKIQAGGAMSVEEIGLPSVLNALAVNRSGQMDFETADNYGRMALTIYESFQRAFDEFGSQSPGARREYFANTTNTLINLGVHAWVGDKEDQANAYTQRAMARALSGDIAGGFLGACSNDFSYCGGVSRVWASLWDIPAARAAARRTGALQPYLELTAMEALLRVERCETEQAMQLADELLAAEKDDFALTMNAAAIAGAHLARSYVQLRRGEVSQAWATFCRAIVPNGSSFVLTPQSKLVTREFAHVLGVSDEGEVLRLIETGAPAPVKPSREAAPVEPETGLPLPYGQHLIGVRDSACAHPLEMALLWKLAVAEFWDDDVLYYKLREEQCAWLMSIGAREALYRAAHEMILRAKRKSLALQSAWYAFAATGAADTGRLREAERLTREGMQHFDPDHVGAGFAASSALYLSVRAGWSESAEAAARAFVRLAPNAAARAAPPLAWLAAQTSAHRSAAAKAALDVLTELPEAAPAKPEHWYDTLPVGAAVAEDPDLGRTRSAYDSGDQARGRELRNWLNEMRQSAAREDIDAARAAFQKIMEANQQDESYRDIEVQACLTYAQVVMAAATEPAWRDQQINLMMGRLLALHAYSALGAVQTLRIWSDILDPNRDPQDVPTSYQERRWLFWFDREPMTQLARANIEVMAALWDRDMASWSALSEEARRLAGYFGTQEPSDTSQEDAPPASERAEPAPASVRRVAIDKAGDLAAAQAAWRSIQLETPERSVDRTGLGDAYAGWCLRNQHYAEAIKAYRWCEREFTALKEWRGRAIAVAGASRALRRLGKLSRARATLTRQLLRMKPDDSEWNNLRMALASVWFDVARRRVFKRGALRQAEEIFRGIADNSNNIEERGRARLGLALVLGLQKRQQEALVAVRFAQEDLSHANPQQAAGLRAAMPAFEAGNWSILRL